MKAVLIGLALLLSACAPALEQTSQIPATAEQSCADRGGRMERVGRAQSLQCVIPYADAGRSCRDGGECQAGRCMGPVDAVSGANVSGQCQATNMAFGCYTTISGGRAQAAICVD